MIGRKDSAVQDHDPNEIPPYNELLELMGVPKMPSKWSPGIVLYGANLPYYGQFVEKVVNARSGNTNPSLAALARVVAFTRYHDRAALSLAGYGHRGAADSEGEELIEGFPSIELIGRMLYGHGVAAPRSHEDVDAIQGQESMAHKSLQPVEAINLLVSEDMESIECGRLTHLFDHAKFDINIALACLRRSIRHFGGNASGNITYRIKDIDNKILDELDDMGQIIYGCVVLERVREVGFIDLGNEKLEVRLRTSFILPIMPNEVIDAETAEKFAALDKEHVDRDEAWSDAACALLDPKTMMSELERYENCLVPISSTAYVFNRSARLRHDQQSA